MAGTHRGVAHLLTGATPTSRLLIIGAVCGTLAIVPLDVLESLPRICLWQRLFGYCYACGTTRALAALLHGDPHRALSYNRNVLLVAPLLLFIVGRDLWQLVRRGRR